MISQDQTPTYEISRESVLKGVIRDYIRAADPSLPLVSDEAQCASVAAMLAGRPDGGGPDGGDVWLFAYGSLIWNPMIHFSEREVVTVAGYHRRFCLWTHLGRGSPAVPGLTLGLEPGGACRGVAFRIAAAAAQAELELVWRREMITNAYCPRWVRMAAPGRRGWAVAFIVNRRHPHYAGLVPEDRVVKAIARARGPLGPCAAYLFNTVEHLSALGVHDRQLCRLRNRVTAALAAAEPG